MSGDYTNRRRSGSIDIAHSIEFSQLDAASLTPSLSSTLNTGYAPIQDDPQSESDTEPLKPPQHTQHTLHHWETVKPRFWKTLIIQIFAFLWLVPIIALLILNIKRHVIGASAWCPGGDCYPAIYAESYRAQLKVTERPAKYERESHNLVGALQFVAKALEVWFIIIASWLVYLMTTKLAERSAGLPIGYLTRSFEFDKIPNLVDPLLWTTLRRLPATRSQSRRARRRIWLFVAFTVFLCLICNLMGPAVAVLVIPTLQWIETREYDKSSFASINSNNPPSLDGFAFNDESQSCSKENFTAQDYSCALNWAASLDSWVESYGASQDSAGLITSIQNMISFTYNDTGTPVTDPASISGDGKFEQITWSPSRQIFNQLSVDLVYIMALSSGDYDKNYTDLADILDTYKEYNSTVQTFVRRNAPVLGGIANVWLDFDDQHHWNTEVDADRSVRCYESYNVSNTPLCWGDCGFKSMEPVAGIYTKCIPTGSGWQDGYKTTNFSVGRQWVSNESFWPEIQMTVHATGKAGFVLDDDPAPRVPRECLTKGGDASQCDWDRLWDESPDPDIRYRSNPMTTIEMTLDTSGLRNTRSSNITIAVDFVTFQTFARYSLDPSGITNPLLTADWEFDLPENATLNDTKPVAVDPAWILAGWAIGAGGEVDSTRSAAAELRDVFINAQNLHSANWTTPEIVYEERYRLDKVGLMPLVQTLGLVEYTSTPAPATDNHDPEHPILYRSGRINVYAYGLSSRTSWVGVLVTIIGCIIVMTEVVLGLQDRRRFRSLTQLLVAALEHTYNGEFPPDMHHDEKNIARVSFRLDHVPDGAGKFKFEKRA